MRSLLVSSLKTEVLNLSEACRFHMVPYPARFWAISVLMSAAYTTVALSDRLGVQLLGVVFSSLQANIQLISTQHIQEIMAHLSCCGCRVAWERRPAWRCARFLSPSAASPSGAAAPALQVLWRCLTLMCARPCQLPVEARRGDHRYLGVKGHELHNLIRCSCYTHLVS